MKLKDYKQAEKLCTKVQIPLDFCFLVRVHKLIKLIKNCCLKVLELESTNVKALYRRAQAHMNLADLDLAELDIKKALELDPDNR